jgi:23S rRNA-/tRNA-specific pseudouridylate synthase
VTPERGAPFPQRPTRAAAPVTVLWTSPQDDERVVFKPAGLSSEQPAAEGDSLLARIRRQFAWPDARLPHRLDRPTRGIVVVARDAAAAARLAAEQREGRWTKWYFARIPERSRDGDAQGLVGPHKAFLRREGRVARVVRSGGDPSRLEVLAVARSAGQGAHALIRLDTGRFHQIRAMLAHLGFPLLGDRDYGGVGVEALDLEAVGLRIDREQGVLRHRLREHADRHGVDPGLERALDAAMDS